MWYSTIYITIHELAAPSSGSTYSVSPNRCVPVIQKSMWVSLEKDMCPSAMLQSVLCSWQALLESSITDNLKAHVMRNKWKGSELHLTEIYKLPSIPFSDNFYQHEGYLSHFGFTLFLCPCRYLFPLFSS